MEHIHLIGIGGTGLSAIARVLKETGYEVSGSDRSLSPLAKSLLKDGIRVMEGHAAGNISGADFVVRSSAIPDDNPEVLAAMKAGIPVLKRSEFLGRIFSEKTGIAIAGTHGKTTTTSMMAWTLTSLGQDPSYIIGGVSKNLGSNAHAGSGNYFVIEADEYDYMFMGLHPSLTIVTNVEHDHPDCYPTPQDYRYAFQAFVGQLRAEGILLVCRDDAGAFELAGSAPSGSKVFSYGLSVRADFQAQNMLLNPAGGHSFNIYRSSTQEVLGRVDLNVPGDHNVRNALAVFTAAYLLDYPTEAISQALGQFKGTGRRFDVLGEAMGVVVVDDYGHHPTEIAATLEAARQSYANRKIWAVWQPHTYTRTETLMAEYIQAFKAADRVIITEIYAARERDNGFSSKSVADQMTRPETTFIPTLKEVTSYILANVEPGTVLLVLSAGDADQVSAAVLARLKEKEAADV